MWGGKGKGREGVRGKGIYKPEWADLLVRAWWAAYVGVKMNMTATQNLSQGVCSRGARPTSSICVCVYARRCVCPGVGEGVKTAILVGVPGL